MNQTVALLIRTKFQPEEKISEKNSACKYSEFTMRITKYAFFEVNNKLALKMFL